MLEALFEALLEFLLELFVEVMTELGLHAVSEPFRKKPNPFMAVLGYAAFGAAAGGLSLLVLPQHLVSSPHTQLVNLVVTPLLVGFAMAQIGALRNRRGERLVRIDRFAYAWLFALMMALIRFRYAH